MAINFENLPREQQRVEIIRQRAEKVWRETKNPDAMLNWRIAEDRLCSEDAEFRCANGIYKFLAESRGVGIETI